MSAAGSTQPGAAEPPDLMGTVYTSTTSRVYHCDADCCDRSTPEGELLGQIEAVIAMRYGRYACPACASAWGKALEPYRAATHNGERFNPAHCPLGRITPDSWTDSEEEHPHIPYGAPEALDDVRFGAPSAAGWGTASYALDPTEYLGEPTEDDHAWGRGSSRFLD